jgi:hypothetical protein
MASWEINKLNGGTPEHKQFKHQHQPGILRTISMLIKGVFIWGLWLRYISAVMHFAIPVVSPFLYSCTCKRKTKAIHSHPYSCTFIDPGFPLWLYRLSPTAHPVPSRTGHSRRFGGRPRESKASGFAPWPKNGLSTLAPLWFDVFFWNIYKTGFHDSLNLSQISWRFNGRIEFSVG